MSCGGAHDASSNHQHVKPGVREISPPSNAAYSIFSKTFLLSHLLNYEHILGAGGFLASAEWVSWSWLTSPLSWTRASSSCGQCSACCHCTFHPQSKHRFKVRTSRPCKALSPLASKLSNVDDGTLFPTQVQVLLSVGVSLESGRWTTCCLRSHLSTPPSKIEHIFPWKVIVHDITLEDGPRNSYNTGTWSFLISVSVKGTGRFPHSLSILLPVVTIPSQVLT